MLARMGYGSGFAVAPFSGVAGVLGLLTSNF
jgi:hypothetical protein